NSRAVADSHVILIASSPLRVIAPSLLSASPRLPVSPSPLLPFSPSLLLASPRPSSPRLRLLPSGARFALLTSCSRVGESLTQPLDSCWTPFNGVDHLFNISKVLLEFEFGSDVFDEVPDSRPHETHLARRLQ